MIHYGVIFFMLEKLGAVVGVSNLHIYAAMRGQTLEEFQKTRNAPARCIPSRGATRMGLGHPGIRWAAILCRPLDLRLSTALSPHRRRQ